MPDSQSYFSPKQGILTEEERLIHQIWSYNDGTNKREKNGRNKCQNGKNRQNYYEKSAELLYFIEYSAHTSILRIQV